MYTLQQFFVNNNSVLVAFSIHDITENRQKPITEVYKKVQKIIYLSKYLNSPADGGKAEAHNPINHQPLS